MPALEYDLSIEQGAYYEKEFTWTADGTPVDLTGWTGEIHMRLTPSGPLLWGKAVTLGGAAGTIYFDMPLPHTALTFTKAMYQIELTPPSGKTIRFAQGTVTVSPEVVHD